MLCRPESRAGSAPGRASRTGVPNGQTEGALACPEKGKRLPISRLDDICLELGMAPDERGQALAPAWLYEGVLRETAQSGRSRGKRRI